VICPGKRCFVCWLFSFRLQLEGCVWRHAGSVVVLGSVFSGFDGFMRFRSVVAGL
jgi:hypothetical protein